MPVTRTLLELGPEPVSPVMPALAATRVRLATVAARYSGRRSGVKEDADRPGWIPSELGEKLLNVKRPACFSVADRRVSKLRP